jgi:hypothetical protein
LLKDHRFIKRIVTCNKKCIYLNNTDLQKQWLDKGQLPVPVSKRALRKKGPPLRLVELRRSYYHELVQDGRMINVDVPSQQ